MYYLGKVISGYDYFGNCGREILYFYLFFRELIEGEVLIECYLKVNFKKKFRIKLCFRCY